MKTKILLTFIFITASAAIWAGNPFAGGDGSDFNPYQISTFTQLDSVRNYLDSCFILINDIDAIASDTANGGAGFTPIGSDTDPFKGKFHGRGHVIKNLKIYRPGSDLVGFISHFSGVDAVMDSLGLVNCDITGEYGVAGLCGFQEDHSLIEHCYVTGKVTGVEDVGGIIGDQQYSTINFSYSTCNVTANYGAGGLIGGQYGSTMNSCYATGTIKADESTAGGLISSNYASSLYNSYFTGKVMGKVNDGGLIGDTYSSTSMNCYSTGSITGNEQIGGFAGVSTDCRVSYCYASGNVFGTSHIGGFLGYDNSNNTFAGCYWNTETTLCSLNVGTGSNPAILGLTTSQLKDSANLDSLSFKNNWKIRIDSTYPGLRGLNNAPFAFRDTLKIGRKTSLSRLLKNDYDLETLQTNLVFRIDSLFGAGTTDRLTWYSFPNATPVGTKDSLYYRVGEVLTTGDTLWGNIAIALILKIQNTAPVITSTAPISAIAGQQYTYTVVGNDAENDLLTYSLSNQPISMTISGNVISWTPPEGIITSGEITVTVSDGELSGTQKFTITLPKGNQTITFSTLPSKTYGDADFNPNASASSGLPVEYSSSNTSVATIINGLIHIAGAGTTNITTSQAGNDMYNAAPDVIQNLTVNKASLTVTADNKTRKVGESNPEFTITYSGWIGTDNADVLDALPTAACEATTVSPAGNYDITVSGGSDNNYNFNYVKGTLTVTPLTVISNVEEMHQLIVFPTSTSGTLYFKGTDVENKEVSIYNLLGSKVWTGNIKRNGINVSGLPKGTYIIQLNDNTKMMTFRFLIE